MFPGSQFREPRSSADPGERDPDLERWLGEGGSEYVREQLARVAAPQRAPESAALAEPEAPAYVPEPEVAPEPRRTPDHESAPNDASGLPGPQFREPRWSAEPEAHDPNLERWLDDGGM